MFHPLADSETGSPQAPWWLIMVLAGNSGHGSPGRLQSSSPLLAGHAAAGPLRVWAASVLPRAGMLAAPGPPRLPPPTPPPGLLSLLLGVQVVAWTSSPEPEVPRLWC